MKRYLNLAVQAICISACALCVWPLAAQESKLQLSPPDPETQPLAAAHAHNDYAHTRPLLDALACGFTSVEADIFLRDKELLVGHTRFELSSHRTLEALYLKPLAQRVRANNGSVYKTGVQKPAAFSLLIDFKSDGEETYHALNSLLQEYRDILCEYKDGKVTRRAVEIVISGDRPFDLLKEADSRLAFLDGRLSDFGAAAPATLMPLISDRWGSHFRWNGQGEFPPKERDKLHSIVEQAHKSGKRVRFWATPESQAMWSALNDAQVDHINTDKLEELSEFLRASKKR